MFGVEHFESVEGDRPLIGYHLLEIVEDCHAVEFVNSLLFAGLVDHGILSNIVCFWGIAVAVHLLVPQD